MSRKVKTTNKQNLPAQAIATLPSLPTLPPVQSGTALSAIPSLPTLPTTQSRTTLPVIPSFPALPSIQSSTTLPSTQSTLPTTLPTTLPALPTITTLPSSVGGSNILPTQSPTLLSNKSVTKERPITKLTTEELEGLELPNTNIDSQFLLTIYDEIKQPIATDPINRLLIECFKPEIRTYFYLESDQSQIDPAFLNLVGALAYQQQLSTETLRQYQFRLESNYQKLKEMFESRLRQAAQLDVRASRAVEPNYLSVGGHLLKKRDLIARNVDEAEQLIELDQQLNLEGYGEGPKSLMESGLSFGTEQMGPSADISSFTQGQDPLIDSQLILEREGVQRLIDTELKIVTDLPTRLEHPPVSWDDFIQLAQMRLHPGTSISKYRSERKLIYRDDLEMVEHIISLINETGFEATLNYLKSILDKVSPLASIDEIREQIIFESPLLKMSRQQYYREIEVLRTKINIKPGDVKCRRCGGKEVMALQVQTRSGDEGFTTKYTCIQCDNHW